MNANPLENAMAVISNYNCDPKEVIQKFNFVVLYDQSDNCAIKELIKREYPNSIDKNNTGHSLSNYFDFVINNFMILPYRIHFLKSNVSPRHIDANSLDRKLQLDGLVPIFNDKNFEDKPRIAYHLLPGFFIERNNSWFMQDAHPSYFSSCNDLLEYIFREPIKPEYLLFAPGGNYSTYGPMLKIYPLNFWKFLYYITSYKFFPPEAYVVERLLFIIFSAEYEINSENFDDLWFEKLELKKKELIGKSTVDKSKFSKSSWFVRRLQSKLIYELDKRNLV